MSSYRILARRNSTTIFDASPRGAALHGVGFVGGGLLLARLWPAHPVWAFLLGSVLGWNAAIVTGDDSWRTP